MGFAKMKAHARRDVLRGGPAVLGLALLVHGCQSLATHMTPEERLYRAKCSSCHRPVERATRSPEEWQALLREHGPKLSEAERAALLTYLMGR